MTSDETDPNALFWRLAEELQEGDPSVEEGTMMSSRCLRRDGEFMAMIDRRNDHLIVKLAESRVLELIDEGAGEAFAPAGRVFREWLDVATPDEGRWRSLLAEARDFAATA
jgi:hypothetical protein